MNNTKEQKFIANKNFSWGAAFLGAAVGIAGPAYSGTLISNIMLHVYTFQGKSLNEAYAMLYQMDLSWSMLIMLLINLGFALTSGWIAAKHGNKAPILHGLASGLLTMTFSIIMLLGPAPASLPFWYITIILLGFPVIGSVIGSFIFKIRFNQTK